MSSEAAPGAPARSGRAWLKWLIRFGVSAIVLAVIFSKVHFEQVWQTARHLPPQLWLGGLVLFLLGHAASAAKWRMLIGAGVSYPEALRAHLAGLAANLALPSVAGGDVVRAALVYGKASDPRRLAAGSVADRVLDTFGLLMIAGLGGLIAFGAGAAGQVRILLLAGLVAVVGIVGLFLSVRIAEGMLEKKPVGGKLGKVLNSTVAAVAQLSREPGRLLGCLAISLTVQALFIGINIAFAEAVGLHVPAAAWFYAWAAAKIIAIAPISLAGIGVREGSMATLLSPFHAPWAQVVAVGLVWQALLITSGLLGLLVQIAWKPAERATPVRAATEPSA
jgi:uncharacterized protein (TIRG00374 family)